MASMHKNMTVTRTISAGNCTGTSAASESESARFPFARRHSSAGVRAFMWATASECSFGSSLGSESRGSKDSIRSIVVTPDSIPQFTIPKLALEDGYRSRSNEKERQSEEEQDWGSTDDIPPRLMSSSLSSSVSSTSSSGFGLSPGPGRKFHGGFSDHAGLKRVSAQSDASFSCPLGNEHCSDPGSRAALSLPHLPKVTTPYGFITLSKSPEMASEETLLQSGHRRSPEVISLRHLKLEMKRSVPVTTLHVQTRASIPPQQSTVSQRFFRSHSVAEIEIRRQLAERKELRSTPAQAPVTKSKQSLWGVLRKHLKNQKETLSISI